MHMKVRSSYPSASSLVNCTLGQTTQPQQGAILYDPDSADDIDDDDPDEDLDI